MCFSATVSFGAAAFLVPAGVYCLRQSHRLKNGFGMLAALPLLFGIQQFIEGIEWQVLKTGENEGVYLAALGFLFFSHFLWLFWVPFASYRVEPLKRKRFFLVLAILGTSGGAWLYLPLLFNPEWVNVDIVKHSIVYHAKMLHDVILPMGLDRALYALVILLPLLYSSHAKVRHFGGLVSLSLLFSLTIYRYAFVSIWCFFAAVLSLYLIYMFRRQET